MIYFNDVALESVAPVRIEDVVLTLLHRLSFSLDFCREHDLYLV